MKRALRIAGSMMLGCALLLSGCFWFSAQPEVDFTASSVEGYTPLAVGFTSVVEESVMSYAWDFGDGSSSSEAHPVHVYHTAGTYTVSLTVELADGRIGLEAKTDYIDVSLLLQKTQTPLLYWVDDRGVFKSGDRSGISESILMSSFLGVDSMEIVGDKVYWLDIGLQKIARSNLDGSEQETVIHGRETYHLPWDFAIDRMHEKLYWVCIPDDEPHEDWPDSWVWSGGIYRANLDGTNIEKLWTYSAGASEYATVIEVDPWQDRVYWVLEQESQSTWKLQYSTTTPKDFVPRTIGEYSGSIGSLALDTLPTVGATHAYFTTRNGVKLIHLSGGPSVEVLSVSMGFSLHQDVLEVDRLADMLFVATPDGILRANSSGSDTEVIFPGEEARALGR